MAGILGIAGLAPRGISAQTTSIADTCPAYRDHLKTARTFLVRGDRSGALTELVQAQEALVTCLRESGETGLASAPPDHRQAT